MFGRLVTWWRQVITWFRSDGGSSNAAAQVQPAAAAQWEPPPSTPAEEVPSGPEPAVSVPPPAAAGGPTPEASAPQVSPGLNRHARRSMDRTRRQLERARIKRDKLVVPKNLNLLTKNPRSPKSSEIEKPVEPIPQPSPEMVCETNDLLIADELVVGDGLGDVLFKESEFFGEYNFRDSILEQLDRYWVYLERMKKHDPSAYDFYKQFGATLVPYSATGINWKLNNYDSDKMTAEELRKYKAEITVPAWFKQYRPAFGCVAMGTDPLTERYEQDSKKWWVPKFVYFTKYNDRPPPELQRKLGGDIYKMTVWWDQAHNKKRKWGTPSDFGIFISDDGETVQVLRQIETKLIPVRHTTGHRRGRIFDIPKREWRIPGDYETWAKQHGLTARIHLAHLFCYMLQQYERSNWSTARVIVHKDDLVAAFGIDPRRTSYFFRDRDVVVHDGGRERIIHYVRPHERHDGSVVKGHFRGAREFTWAGYRVRVTIPGLDHEFIPEIKFPGVSDSYWREKGEKYIDVKQIAKAFTRHIEGGVPLGKAIDEVREKS